MTEPHDWPFEQPARGTLRPWYLTAVGYLAVLFPDSQEAQRAKQGLVEWGVPANDIRLYDAEEVLNIASRLQQERSILAKTIAAVVARPGNGTWATRGRGARPCGCSPRPRTAPINWLGSSPTPLWVLALLRRQGCEGHPSQHRLTIHPAKNPWPPPCE
jgi:hypothetical protein